MNKLRHTLQLLHAGALSTRQIGAALGISKSTVSEIASYARVAGVDWALAQSLNDEELQARLYRPPVARQSHHLEPDHAHIHRELRRPGVTLQLLWEEYQQQHAGQAYKYSAFCEKYKAWARRLKRSMRQSHEAGDKLFVDYAGQTVPVVSMPTPVRSARRRSSWRCWAHPTTPMPAPPLARRRSIGWPASSLRWSSSAACRASWCPTSRARSWHGPTATSPPRTACSKNSRRITAVSVPATHLSQRR